MSQCPSDADIFVTAQDPNYSSESEAAKAMSGPDVLEENLRSSMNDYADAEEHTKAAQDVYDSIGVDAPGGRPADAHTRNEIRSIARRLTAADAQAAASARVQQLNNDYMDLLRQGTSVHRAGFYFKAQTSLARRLKDQTASFSMWANTYHHQNDRSLLNNDLVLQHDIASAKIQGHLEEFSHYLDPVKPIVADIKKHLRTVKDDEVLRDIGNFAVYRHTPEANAAILQRWDAESKAAAAKGDLEEAAKYQSWAEDLSKHIDMDVRDDANARLRTATGYTNGEAARLTQELLDKGYSLDELNAAADVLCSAYNQIYNRTVEAGIIDPTMAAAIDAHNFQYYVPAMERKVSNGGAVNDVQPFNPGGYYARDGRIDAVDDGFTSINKYARRGAQAIGMKDFNDVLLGMALFNAKNRGKTGVDNGLRLKSFNSIVRNINRDPNSPFRSQLSAYEQTGGCVIERPFQHDDGTVSMARWVIMFDPDYVDANGTTGAELNESLIVPSRKADTFGKMARATSLYGQQFTRFRPAHAPINALRDTLERAHHLAAGDYFTEDGRTISGLSVVHRMFASIPTATTTLTRLKLGKFDPNSPTGKLYEEYRKMGLHHEYTFGTTGIRQTDIDRVTEGQQTPFQKALNTVQGKALRAAAEKLGNSGKFLLNILDHWNDTLNNVAPFAEYMALRDAGVPMDKAAAAVHASMNPLQSGTATPIMQALYPFVKPTVQSAAALARSLGMTYDPRGFFQPRMKGWAYAAGVYAAYTSIKDIIAEQLGEDEHGNPRIDSLSLSQLSTFIPIGTGDPDGSYFKLQHGFGLNPVIATLVWGEDRLERGLITADEFGSQMLFTVVKNMAPGNWPEFSPSDDIAAFVVHTLAPTLAKDVLAVATNTNYFGSPIKRGEAPEFTAKADYGSRGAAKIYHEMAQDLYRTTGIDMYPEQIQYVLQSWTNGPLRILRSLWEKDTVGPQTTQKYKDEHLDPLLEAMGGTLFTGKATNVSRNLYFRARDHYARKSAKDGIRMSAKDYGEYGSKEAFQRAQLLNAGWSEAEIQDWMTIYEAEQHRAKGSKDMNKILRNRWASAFDLDELREGYVQYEQSNDELYSSIIDKLSYFRNTR